MNRWFLVLVLLAVVVSCGKNEGVRSIPAAPPPPSNPPTQAPPPSGGYPGGYGPVGGYNPGTYPPGTGYPGGPAFQPQMPPGMPPQYYPFLPIDNYMRQQRMAPYWNQVWGNWQNYAGYQDYDIYDFNVFWYDYCPQIWEGTSMAGVYNSIDINFYDWVDPYSTQFSPDADPSYFWFNYSGMSY